MMQYLGIEVSGTSNFEVKMANNSLLNCVLVVKSVKVMECDIQVGADMNMLPIRGKGYPMISTSLSWL